MGRPRTFIDCGDFFLRRWWADRDAEQLFRLIEESLGHLGPWMPWVSRHSREATRDFLAGADRKWRSGDAFAFAIGMGGRLVGSCALYRAAEPRGRVLGYWPHPAATGRGVATRAAAALASEAFALLGVAYVEIVHDVANTASGAVPRRLGFAEVRRVPVTPPAAPSDRGIDVVWRLARPAPPGAARISRCGGEGGEPRVASMAMTLRVRMRQALPEAMRARDKAAVSALRGALGALDNAEAVPLDALAQAPSGAGGSEAARRELSERDVEDIVRAEVAERVEAAAELPGPAHAERAARLRAEADVLLRFLDARNTTA